MKKQKSLSELIRQAKQSEANFSKKDVKRLLDSGIKPGLDNIRSNHPRKVNRLFKPLNFIVMISIITMIGTILFLSSPDQEMNQFSNYQPSDREVVEIMDTAEMPEFEEISIEIEELADEFSEPVAKANTIPKDTVKQGQFLELTKKELARLGFEFDEFGYYYMNQLADGDVVDFFSYYKTTRTSSGGASGFSKHPPHKHRYNQKEVTKKSYYPVCTSSIYGTAVRSILYEKGDIEDRFEFINDTLSPIVFRSSEMSADPMKDNDILVWFKTDESFYTDLYGVEGKELFQNSKQIKEYVALNPDRDYIIYDFPSINIGLSNLIILDRSHLPCLGFREVQDSLIYLYPGDVVGAEYSITPYGIGFRGIFDPSELNSLSELPKVAPLFTITDTRFRGTIRVNPLKFYDVDSTVTRNNWIDVCVPIRFTGDSGQVGSGSTFWFYPCEELFNCLPDSIGGPMRREFNANVKPLIENHRSIVTITIIERPEKEKTEILDPVPCEYFPSFCEGLPGLDNLIVYPNPATDQISIEVLLSRSKTINYQIFDLSGRLLNDDLSARSYQGEGKYTEKMDISDLKSGFYLLVLSDNEGSRMTKRILKN